MKQYAELSDDDIFNTYKIISYNIKKIRQNKKISQSDIALAMGFTTPTFYTNAENYNQGKHFNLEHIIRIANYLEVNISEFFKDIKTKKD